VCLHIQLGKFVVLETIERCIDIQRSCKVRSMKGQGKVCVYIPEEIERGFGYVYLNGNARGPKKFWPN
jgi:hypothetical protein